METTEISKKDAALYKAKDLIKAAFEYTDNDGYKKLRNALVTDNKFDAVRNDKLFKWGAQMILYLIDAMTILEYTDGDINSERLRRDTIRDVTDHMIGECRAGVEDDHLSILKVIEAFNILTINPREWGIEDRELIGIKALLDTIAYCQRLILDTYKNS